MKEEYKEFKLIVTHTAMVHICADSEKDAIHQWNDAINRNFGHAEVIEVIEEFNEDSLKWDSIPDEEKKEWEDAFYDVPKED